MVFKPHSYISFGSLSLCLVTKPISHNIASYIAVLIVYRELMRVTTSLCGMYSMYLCGHPYMVHSYFTCYFNFTCCVYYVHICMQVHILYNFKRFRFRD